MPNEELEMRQEELKLKWVMVKLKMTTWLNDSMTGMPVGEKASEIKCMVDSIAVMEKLAGVSAETPEDLDKGLKTLGKRTKNIAKRLDFDEGEE
jgi:hypothetical protein